MNIVTEIVFLLICGNEQFSTDLSDKYICKAVYSCMSDLHETESAVHVPLKPSIERDQRTVKV